MEITVNKGFNEELEIGDIAILRVAGKKVIRFIVFEGREYFGVDLSTGECGLRRESLKGLMKSYQNVYDDVKIIKNKRAELIINEV